MEFLQISSPWSEFSTGKPRTRGPGLKWTPGWVFVGLYWTNFLPAIITSEYSEEEKIWGRILQLKKQESLFLVWLIDTLIGQLVNVHHCTFLVIDLAKNITCSLLKIFDNKTPGQLCWKSGTSFPWLWILVQQKQAKMNRKTQITSLPAIFFGSVTVSVSYRTTKNLSISASVFLMARAEQPTAFFQLIAGGTKHHLWFVLCELYQMGGGTGYSNMWAGKYTTWHADYLGKRLTCQTSPELTCIRTLDKYLPQLFGEHDLCVCSSSFSLRMSSWRTKQGKARPIRQKIFPRGNSTCAAAVCCKPEPSPTQQNRDTASVLISTPNSYLNSRNVMMKYYFGKNTSPPTQIQSL